MRRNRLIFAASAGLLIAAAVTGYALWPRPVPPPDAPSAELIKFIATDRFTKLPEAVQSQYVDRLTSLTIPQLILAAGDSGLSEEQRGVAFNNGRNAWIAKHIPEYFHLPPGQPRQAYLDNLLSSVPMQIANASGGWASDGRGRPMTPQAIKQWIESVPPSHRALAAEFTADLERRRGSSNPR
jgi:hypothetical protein